MASILRTQKNYPSVNGYRTKFVFFHHHANNAGFNHICVVKQSYSESETNINRTIVSIKNTSRAFFSFNNTGFSTWPSLIEIT